jgi:hypothetical protein
MESGWPEELAPYINRMVMRMTEAVRDDAQKICPVDTGALKASLTAINAAPGVGRVISDLPYAAAVEFGFDGEEIVSAHMRLGRPVREHTRHGRSPEQPYLRPALYRERDESGGTI